MSLYLGTTKIKNVNVLFNDGQGSFSSDDIKKGVTIMGIEGTFTDETKIAGAEKATPEDIIVGKAAFINGNQVSGSLKVNNYFISDEVPADSVGNDGDIFLKL